MRLGCGWSRLIGRIARAADSPASPIRWTLRRRRGRRSRRSAPEPRKTVTGQVEALRALRVARRSAVDQRADCQRRIKALIVTAPDARRERLRRLPLHELLEVCAGLRPDLDRAGDPEQATKLALRQLARRHAALSAEIHELDNVLTPSSSRSTHGWSPSTALALTSRGSCSSPPGRTANGSAPRPPSPCSAASRRSRPARVKTNRHRLNRGGDRQANAAIYRVVLCRMRWDPRTHAYVQRRTAQGLSKKDIIRCLKRLIAREIYHAVRSPSTTAKDLASAA